MPVPLQLPGGVELLVVLLMLLLPLALVAVLIGAIVYVLRQRSTRVEELEARIDALESELSERDSGESD